jgi:DNA-binding LytR/AlgR family response regulator
MNPSALIAEDEPLLAQALQADLALLWPQLKIVATVGDGASAVTQAMAAKPDLLFLDIRMPGLSGLEAAADLADAWPAPSGPAFPLIVFVTAYDQYAVQAFEAQAVDYLIKPVQPERLQKTVARLQAALAGRAQQRAQAQSHPSAAADPPSALEQAVVQLRQLLAAAPNAAGAATGAMAPLQVIQASDPGSDGQRLRLVPLAEVVYFEAADKYLRVVTATHEHLIRTPLKDLLPQLDASQFWQVHRSLVVRVAAIEEVRRDEAGKLSIGLRQRKERLAVSRLYAQLFKAM